MKVLAAMSAVAMLGGYGHGRRLEMLHVDEPPPEDRYIAADWGAKPATSVTGADLQRIADADAKRARKAAKRFALLRAQGESS
jgi:hypothetical protein